MSYFLIIRGPLGCGKSTVSKQLAAELGAMYIAVDDVLETRDLTGEKEDGYISQKSFQKANEIIAPGARKSMEAGKPVIFDGNFYWQSTIEDLLGRLPYPHHIFTLSAPLAVCIERDSVRQPAHGKDAATVVYDKTMSFSYGTEIDATQSIEEIIEEIKNKIT